MAPLSTRSKSLLILLVLLAASEFVVRGPVRFLRVDFFNDFISPYIQSRALVKGMDPYSPEVLVRLWRSAGLRRPLFLAQDLAKGSLLATRGIPTAYPLSCLSLLAPLAVLPWPVAHFAWLVITVGLTLGLIWSLLAAGGFERRDWRFYVFAAFALALAPLQTGLAAGNIVISAVALCGIAMSLEQRGGEMAAGVLFGMAVLPVAPAVASIGDYGRRGLRDRFAGDGATGDQRHSLGAELSHGQQGSAGHGDTERLHGTESDSFQPDQSAGALVCHLASCRCRECSRARHIGHFVWNLGFARPAERVS
jgi:hypothetical protein